MDDTVFVEYFVAIGKLLKEEPDLLIFKFPLLSDHVLVQISLVTVLHNKIEIILRRDLAFHAIDQIRMMGQLF